MISLYKKYERWVPIIFFFLGFLFDLAVLHRIDEPLVIFQQALYLVVAAIFIGVELVETTREVHPPWLLKGVWKYREPLLHFLLGTLLNSFTIFYFKSASAFTSFLFIFILIAVLIMNEFKRFGERQTQVHMAFLSLCLISYFVSLAPILLGFVGNWPFLGANFAAIIVFAGYYQFMKKRLTTMPALLHSHLIKPFVAIQVTFALLYFCHAIPPVPLSVSYMGIFHGIQKEQGEYRLTYNRPYWKFWQHGDQTFYSRPGDVIHCFVRVFSPTKFKDKLQIRWLYKDDKKGWQSRDVIPFQIFGGREEGYRGVVRKSNYEPGRWRVQVETEDSREVGRIDLVVYNDTEAEPREARSILQ